MLQTIRSLRSKEVVSQMTARGLTVVFKKSTCEVYDQNGLIGFARNVGGLYRLDCNYENCMVSTSTEKETWHRRLGHINENSMNQMKKGSVSGVNYANTETKDCIPCAEGKQCRNSFQKNVPKAEELLERIHSDVCGPMEKASIGGNRYFVTFIDEASRKVFVEFLKNR